MQHRKDPTHQDSKFPHASLKEIGNALVPLRADQWVGCICADRKSNMQYMRALFVSEESSEEAQEKMGELLGKHQKKTERRSHGPRMIGLAGSEVAKVCHPRKTVPTPAQPLCSHILCMCLRWAAMLRFYWHVPLPHCTSWLYACLRKCTLSESALHMR